jgi:uncharacterized protein YndB with AHSA1/START domain
MTASDGLWLEMTRLLGAPRPDVFTALTDPHELAKWWGPRGFTVPGVDLDPQVGGSFRIAMQPSDGDLFHLSGEFREFDPPRRISYTFRWEPPDPDDRETVVTMSLEDRGTETEIRFRQGEFATEERRTLHEGGWGDSFERLDELLG